MSGFVHAAHDPVPVAGRLPTDAVVIPVVVAAGLSVVAVVASTMSDGSLVATVLPLLFGGLLWWLIWVAPLRSTLAVMMFLTLAIDRPGDAEGRWTSPFATIGGIMVQNLNHFFEVDALKVSGLVLLLCYLLAVRGYRVLSGRGRDTAGSLEPAAPLFWSIVAAVVTLLASALFGALRGGSLQMVKIQTQGFLQLLAVAYLFSVSLRGPRDYRALAKVIVAAASAKAVIALWVRHVLPEAFPDRLGVMREMERATHHGDSILFACGLAAIIAPLFYRPTPRRWAWVLLLAPLIIAGMVANDRRIAWLQVDIMLFVLAAMNWRSQLSRRLAQAAVLVSPLLLVYCLVGWSSSSRIFAPVQFVRSVVQPVRGDGTIDRSTLYRDIENFNLVYTLRPNPVLGTGLGHPFQEPVKADDISGFKEYAYLPHNSLLGLWSFTGAVGGTGIFAIILIALFLGVRSHARAVSSDHSLAASLAIGCICAYLVHLWADIGFSEVTTIFPVGLAIAVTGQLAVATGAWPSAWRRAGVTVGRRPPVGTGVMSC
jgi:hypothetical protein